MNAIETCFMGNITYGLYIKGRIHYLALRRRSIEKWNGFEVWIGSPRSSMLAAAFQNCQPSRD
jgi:hypothetical protein